MFIYSMALNLNNTSFRPHIGMFNNENTCGIN